MLEIISREKISSLFSASRLSGRDLLRGRVYTNLTRKTKLDNKNGTMSDPPLAVAAATHVSLGAHEKAYEYNP